MTYLSCYIHFANLINAVSLNIGLYNDLFCLMINCNQAEKKIFVSVFIITISFVLFSFIYKNLIQFIHEQIYFFNFCKYVDISFRENLFFYVIK